MTEPLPFYIDRSIKDKQIGAAALLKDLPPWSQIETDRYKQNQKI